MMALCAGRRTRVSGHVHRKEAPTRKASGPENAHELDGVVPEVLDARQDVGGELFVGPDFGLGRRDADYVYRIILPSSVT
jgi:hypothetical protein